MTSLITTTNDTGVSILTAVSTAANQTTKAIKTIGYSLDMLDAFVIKARKEQIVTHELEIHNNFTAIRQRITEERATRETELARKLTADPLLKSAFEQSFAESEAIFQAALLKASTI